MNFKTKKYNIKNIYIYFNYLLNIFILIILNNYIILAFENQKEDLKKLVGINLEKNDFMGSSVAISNNYAVVSVFGDNANEDDDDYLRKNGSVALYKLVENEWKLLKNLVPNSSRDYDAFGSAIAIDGDYIVVSAPTVDYYQIGYNKKTSVGAIYIFKKDFGGIDNWGEIKKITPTDLYDYIYFGNSVAISGDNIIVGAYKDYYDYPEFGLFETGSAYIYEKNSGGLDNWGEVKKIISSDKQMNNKFGSSVAINNDYAIVGAIGNDLGADSPNYNAGAAYIYQKDFGGINNWGEVKKLIPSTPGLSNMFGYSVDIDNNYAVVGSPSYESVFTSQIGKNNYSSAYIFEKNMGGSNNWGEIKQLTPKSIELFNNFGSSVSISDDYIAIGSSEEKFDDLNKNKIKDAGAVYIYHKNYGGIDNWGQYKKIIPKSRNEDDEFGYSVAINGENIIIGSPYCNEKSTNNTIIENSGAVFIYSNLNIDTINNINSNQNIHIYPNPSTNILNIELDKTKNYKSLSVYNDVGMEIYSKPIINNYISLNTLEFSNGLYYIYITNEVNEKITQSFLIIK